jgi:hypothetical protein
MPLSLHSLSLARCFIYCLSHSLSLALSFSCLSLDLRPLSVPDERAAPSLTPNPHRNQSHRLLALASVTSLMIDACPSLCCLCHPYAVPLPYPDPWLFRPNPRKMGFLPPKEHLLASLYPPLLRLHLESYVGNFDYWYLYVSSSLPGPCRF